MLSKSAKFFSILLFISTILIAKNSENSNNIKDKLKSVISPQECDSALELLLAQYDQVISKKLRQDIIKMIKGFKCYSFCELIGYLLAKSEAPKENKSTVFEETCRYVPVIKERVTIIQAILRMKKKPASNFLVQEIAKLTEGYTALQLSIFVFDLTEETEINLLDEKICLKKFKKVFDKLHSRQLKRLDMTLKEELPNTNSVTK